MILITGANGNLGRRLVAALAADQAVRAVVRSERAAALISTAGVDVRVIDYLDQAAMTEAASGCTRIVHLVGIIKESEASTFQATHVDTTAVLIRAAEAAGVSQLLYLSILGATINSSNACLASKAEAETLLLASRVPALVLRVPMVLGEGDYASRALLGRARGPFSVQLRAGSLEQPIYAGDVMAAILSGLQTPLPAESLVLDLAGPESLTRRALTQRAAAMLDNRTRVVSLPLWIGMLLAWLFERLSPSPPLSRAMLGVLDHDDRIDPQPALNRLGISLTPLDESLRRCLVESASG